MSDLNPIYYAPELVQRNPYLRDSLLLGEGGRRTISKVTPSFVHNTVDNPIFPNSGKRLTGSVDFAGIGGNTNFIKPRVEYAHFRPLNRRMCGRLPRTDRIRPSVRVDGLMLPITETLYLGGEYTIRGFDIRSIGPRDPETGLVLGGNKTMLFNGEFLINIAGPVRLVLFYDAGQVRNIGQSFAWKEDINVARRPEHAGRSDDPFTTTRLVDPNAPPPYLQKIGETYAFKTSTGAEVRFFMPVLNVPFRLIFAYNPSRFGVLDNNLQPAKKFTFKFAVGSTF